jgi:short-subunit dehydrogenase
LYNTNIFVSAIAPGPIHSNLRKNALEHYEKNLSEKNTVHRELYTRMEKYFFKLTASEKRFTEKPDAVTQKLILALESKRPKAHYYVTFSAHLFAFLRRILPDSVMNALMVRINRDEMG